MEIIFNKAVEQEAKFILSYVLNEKYCEKVRILKKEKNKDFSLILDESFLSVLEELKKLKLYNDFMELPIDEFWLKSIDMKMAIEIALKFLYYNAVLKMEIGEESKVDYDLVKNKFLQEFSDFKNSEENDVRFKNYLDELYCEVLGEGYKFRFVELDYLKYALKNTIDNMNAPFPEEHKEELDSSKEFVLNLILSESENFEWIKIYKMERNNLMVGKNNSFSKSLKISMKLPEKYEEYNIRELAENLLLFKKIENGIAFLDREENLNKSIPSEREDVDMADNFVNFSEFSKEKKESLKKYRDKYSLNPKLLKKKAISLITNVWYKRENKDILKPFVEEYEIEKLDRLFVRMKEVEEILNLELFDWNLLNNEEIYPLISNFSSVIQACSTIVTPLTFLSKTIGEIDNLFKLKAPEKLLSNFLKITPEDKVYINSQLQWTKKVLNFDFLQDPFVKMLSQEKNVNMVATLSLGKAIGGDSITTNKFKIEGMPLGRLGLETDYSQEIENFDKILITALTDNALNSLGIHLERLSEFGTGVIAVPERYFTDKKFKPNREMIQETKKLKGIFRVKNSYSSSIFETKENIYFLIFQGINETFKLLDQNAVEIEENVNSYFIGNKFNEFMASDKPLNMEGEDKFVLLKWNEFSSIDIREVGFYPLNFEFISEGLDILSI